MAVIVMFWPFDLAKNSIQGDVPEGSDTLQWQLGEEIAWAEIGWWNGTRQKKKIPLYSHRKRVTSELHDSYFRSMTITQAIPKNAEVTHPDRQISEEIVEAWRRVRITAWEFEGNTRPTNWTEDSWVELERSRRDVVRKASTQQTGLQGSGWAAMENEKDTTLTAITSGSKYYSLCSVFSSLSHAKSEQPFCSLTNKVRGK